jgi:hypothetical protein
VTSILILSTHLRLGLPSDFFLLAFPPISYMHSSSPPFRPCPRRFVTFRKKLIFYGGELSSRPTPKMEDHPLSAYATACSIYSQLLSIPGGRLLHPQPDDAPAVVTKDPPSKDWGVDVFYSPLLSLGRLFSFLILYTVGRTPWTGDEPVSRPLPAHKHRHKKTYTIQTHPCLEWDSHPRSHCWSVCIDPHFHDLGGSWRSGSASRPCRFTPGERAPVTHWIGGWVNPRAGLDDVEKRKFLTLPGLEL